MDFVIAFALRFLLATDSDSLTWVLRTVSHAKSGFLFKQSGPTRPTGHPGAVTLIHRFGTALNLNIHVHMILVQTRIKARGLQREMTRQEDQTGRFLRLGVAACLFKQRRPREHTLEASDVRDPRPAVDATAGTL